MLFRLLFGQGEAVGDGFAFYRKVVVHAGNGFEYGALIEVPVAVRLVFLGVHAHFGHELRDVGVGKAPVIVGRGGVGGEAGVGPEDPIASGIAPEIMVAIGFVGGDLRFAVLQVGSVVPG